MAWNKVRIGTVSNDRDQIDDPELAAANWVVRLDDDRADATVREEFELWLAANPANSEAFRSAQLNWSKLGQLAASPGSLARHSMKMERPGAIPAAAMGKKMRLVPRAMLAASIAFGVLISSAWLGNPVTWLSADHRTGIAQTSSFTLEDGTRVDLGPSSAIAVDYDHDERRVVLLSGIAYFTAIPQAKAGGRPFVVEAGNGASQALGTRFQVNRTGDHVGVTVVEHNVAISAKSPEGSIEQAVLAPGQSIRYDTKGRIAGLRESHPDLALAWQKGQLVFDRVPLNDVVAELNRYRAGRIVVFGDELGARTVSGVFYADDVDGALKALAAEFDARNASGPLLSIIY